jgi:hypothetical protein
MDRCRSGLRGAGLSRGENDRAGLRYAPISHDRSAGAMERDLRHMRLAIWKNNQPPNAMPAGQSTKESTLLDIGTTPVL